MRKLEGLVKELVEEMDFLKKREERFTRTNSSSSVFLYGVCITIVNSVDKRTCTKLCMVYHPMPHHSWRLANLPSSFVLQTKVSYRLSLLITQSFSLDGLRWGGLC